MKRKTWLGVTLLLLVGTGEASGQSDTPPASRIDPAWADIPVTQPASKPGNYFAAPSGGGYYSLMDWLHGDYRDSAPPAPYPPQALMPLPFFDVNWKFLDDPEKSWGWTDGLKRQPLGNNLLLTTGGSLWWRHMNETNARLSGINQDYDLLRTRLYADLSYQDQARFFFEFIDSQRLGGELPPLRIDESRADILNAFVDIHLFETSHGDWYARLGRQELMFGSQRMISALDWANTRRTFDGVRFFNRTKETDLDIWWAQPVMPDAGHLDQVDGNQHLVGAWLTKRTSAPRTADYYYLYAGNTAPTPQLGRAISETHVHTFGMRQVGNIDRWQYDYEGMLQLGEYGSEKIVAGSITAGHGYHFADLPMNPMFWVYYDWASGDSNPGSGDLHTFQPLFPFGHYYLGFADIVGRQNIHDINAHLNLFPANWITFSTQFHHYTLANSRDALYNPAGVATRQDLTGAAGRNVGNELDFLLNFHINPHTDMLVGYSKLWSGRFIRDTGPGASAELFYVQGNLRW